MIKETCGALYTQEGKKIADIQKVELNIERQKHVYPDDLVKKKVAQSWIFKGKISCDRRLIYSIMYGMKITNNYLKLHGGTMVRNVAGRKHKRKRER